MKIEKIKLSALKLDPENAKEHPDFQVQQIIESIKRFGFCDPIGVWGDDNLIVEGHGRYMALLRLGYTEAECIRLDHLTEDERKAYAIAHNSTNMTTGFNPEQLQKTLADLAGKFDMESFGVLLAKVDDAASAKEDDYEMPEDLPNRVKAGEVWELGRHRLVCGDSTEEETYDRLMGGGYADLTLTDPPYNVNYKGGTQEALRIENDNMGAVEFRAFLTRAFKLMNKYTRDGGAFYVWLASREHVNFEAALNAAGFTVRQQLIWVKNALVLGRQDYQWRHEPCLYGWKDGAPHYFRDTRSQTTVQESEAPENLKKLKKEELLALATRLLESAEKEETTILRENKPAASELHPTMKPIKLMARLIANSTKRDDVVLDPFGGSGSTLMACEQLGRVCRTVELSERYASAIVDRWEKYTGLKAKKVEDGIREGS